MKQYNKLPKHVKKTRYEYLPVSEISIPSKEEVEVSQDYLAVKRHLEIIIRNLIRKPEIRNGKAADAIPKTIAVPEVIFARLQSRVSGKFTPTQCRAVGAETGYPVASYWTHS